MFAKFLAIAVALSPGLALADTGVPLFGSAASGAVQLGDATGSLDQARLPAQLKIKTNYRCTIETCPNPRNFAKGKPANSALPQ